jgi:hypothetical protein
MKESLLSLIGKVNPAPKNGSLRQHLGIRLKEGFVNASGFDRGSFHPGSSETRRVVRMLGLILVFACTGAVLAQPVLPSPAPPKTLPTMSTGCKQTVDTFAVYLAEYNTQTQQNNPVGRARALNTLGVISICVNRDDQAALEFKTSIGLTAPIKTDEALKVLLDARLNYGIMFRDSKRSKEAFEQFKLGLAASKDKPNFKQEAATFHLTIGALEQVLGKCDEAKVSLGAASEMYKAIGGQAGKDGVATAEFWSKQPCKP